MKHSISILPIEEYDKLTLYSFTIDNNVDTEFENFLNKIEQVNEHDASNIVNEIDKIAKYGAQERYFRYEGKKSDNVCALPDHYLYNNELRLYVIRYSELVVIIGNGGIKTTDTYQEDKYLDKCVTVLQRIDAHIQESKQIGNISITDKTITGDLDFTIYT